MKIGPHEIGKAPFIIAEVGLNHNGSIERAHEMIQAAKYAGADCVKFQTFKADQFCRPDDPLYPTFKACELPDEAWPMLKMACDRAGILFMSTPQNRSDLDVLLPLGIPAIKVGSDDFCNLPLLEDYASEGLPMILSTGMSDGHDITKVQNALHGHEVIYLLCTSQYPTPLEEVRIARLATLKKHIAPARVGFSDHTGGRDAVVMAAALGACVFETHFTLDRDLPGPDHAWSLKPGGLCAWVDAIHRAWAMRGNQSLSLTSREAEQKRKYQRKSGQQLRNAP